MDSKFNDSDPNTQPLAPLDGEPDAARKLCWCRRCNSNVKPEGKGQCPQCGTFLPQNVVARRHTVNVVRRDALLADLLKQFPPANIIERSNCEQLASVLEQLDTIKVGTTEWQRLVTTAQTLGATLHDAQSSRPIELSQAENRIAKMTSDQMIERLETLLVQARRLRDTERANVVDGIRILADEDAAEI